MISGVLYALLAGLMWGLIFVGPLLVPEYPAMLQSMGRYLALGLIALPLAWLGRARLRQLSRHDWWTALGLTMMGNLIYYVCLASAIQRTGAPVSTMIIGTLPVVLPVFANLLYSQRDGKLPWRRLFPALICIAVGLICVNVAELRQGLPNFSPWRYGSGIALALGSVGLLGLVCPAQRPLAAGEPASTANDVGYRSGAGDASGFAGRLSRRLRLAARSAGRVSPALRPASGGVYYADAGHRGALLMGRRAMLEYCQPAAADGDPRPAYRLRNPGRTAVYLPAAAKLTAAADPERHPAAGARRGLRRTRQTGKTDAAAAGGRKKVASPP